MSNAICTGLTSSGKFFSDGEEVDLDTLARPSFADGFLAGPRNVLAPWPGRVRLRIRRTAACCCRRSSARTALGDRPDRLVAVGGHNVEDLHLALKDIVVGRQHVSLRFWLHVVVDVARIVANERQERAIAVRRVAVGVR